LDWSAVWQEIRAGLAAMLGERWLEAVYRFFSNQRWTIEECLKAIKTGCEFEKRQLQDYEALVNLLAGVCAHCLSPDLDTQRS
jgi:hypothetical protein